MHFLHLLHVLGCLLAYVHGFGFRAAKRGSPTANLICRLPQPRVRNRAGSLVLGPMRAEDQVQLARCGGEVIQVATRSSLSLASDDDGQVMFLKRTGDE